MGSTTRRQNKRLPPGAWHSADALWGESQRVRLVTGPPTLICDPIQVRSIHIVAFVENQNDILIVQNKDHSWTFPGGRLEGCETHIEALDREVWEEARAIVAPGWMPVAATRIEFLNRVPGRVYRVHPTYLLWVMGAISRLSDEPHHDPADSVIGRRVVSASEARTLLPELEQTVLDVVLTLRS